MDMTQRIGISECEDRAIGFQDCFRQRCRCGVQTAVQVVYAEVKELGKRSIRRRVCRSPDAEAIMSRSRNPRRGGRSITKKTQNLVKGRDKGICGQHLGGCGQEIPPVDQTIDHMIPRDFAGILGNEVNKYWNLQMTCESCNNERGQNLNTTPEFKCTCHYHYEEADGSRYVFFHNRKVWEAHLYHRGAITEAENLPGKRCPSDRFSFSLLSGRNRKISGFHSGKFGHIVPRSTFFGRMLGNSWELARVGRWNQVPDELQQLMLLYQKHGGSRALWLDGYGRSDVIWQQPLITSTQFMGEVYALWLLARLYSDGDIEKRQLWLIEDYELYEGESARRGLAENILQVDRPNYENIEKEYLVQLERYVNTIPYTVSEFEAPEGQYSWRLLLPIEWLSIRNRRP